MVMMINNARYYFASLNDGRNEIWKTYKKTIKTYEVSVKSKCFNNFFILAFGTTLDEKKSFNFSLMYFQNFMFSILNSPCVHFSIPH